MNNKLLVFGDSWTWGQNICENLNIPDTLKEQFRNKNCYARLLANKLKRKCFNYGIVGNSNSGIFSDIKRYYKDEDFIVVGLTSPYRVKIYSDILKKWVNISYANDVIGNELFVSEEMKKRKEAILEVRQKIVDITDEQIIENYKKCIDGIFSICPNAIVFSAFSECDDVRLAFYPKSIIELFPDNINSCKANNSQTIPFKSAFLTSCSHPNHRGHQFIADMLYKHIKENNVS